MQAHVSEKMLSEKLGWPQKDDLECVCIKAESTKLAAYGGQSIVAKRRAVLSVLADVMVQTSMMLCTASSFFCGKRRVLA